MGKRITSKKTRMRPLADYESEPRRLKRSRRNSPVHTTDEFGREIRPSPPRSSSVSPEIQDQLIIKRSPSPSYLTLSEEPSSAGESSRKLLILDLNGTLLRRSPRSSAHSGLRMVYPRPYFPSLKSYLFHEKTREWLDTMIWSSAQPHSVRDMVQRCFGNEEILSDELFTTDESQTPRRVVRAKHLVAVWARDTLGLSKAAYSKCMAS